MIATAMPAMHSISANENSVKKTVGCDVCALNRFSNAQKLSARFIMTSTPRPEIEDRVQCTAAPEEMPCATGGMEDERGEEGHR
jgi:hypothetical protein